MSYVRMSSLPSEAEARKILADKRSGQAVMDDYLKSQAEALGFIDTASEDDESRASSQNDAAPLVAAPTLVAEPAASAATVAEGPADRKLDASKKDFTLCGALCGSPGPSATVAADAAGSATSVGAATSGAASF